MLKVDYAARQAKLRAGREKPLPGREIIGRVVASGLKEFPLDLGDVRASVGRGAIQNDSLQLLRLVVHPVLVERHATFGPVILLAKLELCRLVLADNCDVAACFGNLVAHVEAPINSIY